ncbi:MAG: hypothetical protein FK732_01960 [Asgard group archaeon]|nr:hypothetical protein [Asgard group archaeon]
MMNRKKAILCIGLLTLALSISLYTITTSNVVAKDYQATLSYGEYYHVAYKRTLDNTSSIEWSFTGTSTSVGIEVWVFNDVNFTIFQGDTTSDDGYQLSDGSY